MISKTLDWLKILIDISDHLTIKKIIATLILGLGFAILVVGYENRAAIFQNLVSPVENKHAPTDWEIGNESKTQLVKLVSSSDIINFVMVSAVDLQLNRRESKFWFTDSDTKTEVQNLLPQPVFDDNPKNTDQMVAVLSNEFTCGSINDTIYPRYSFKLTTASPVICRIAIPPFYGRFVGILTFGLNRAPSPEERDAIRLEASRLAVEIYLKDITKK